MKKVSTIELRGANGKLLLSVRVPKDDDGAWWTWRAKYLCKYFERGLLAAFGKTQRARTARLR